MKASLKNILYPFLIILLSVVVLPVVAQSGNTMSQQDVLLIVAMSMVLLVAILVLVVALYMVNVLKAILRQEQPSLERQKEEKAKKPNFWKRFSRKLNDSVPVEEEEKIMLDHDYDGIRELDNHLPPWWKWMFYITIIISVIYLFVYHVIGVFPLQHEEYMNEMEQAEEMQAKLAETGAVESIDISNPEISTKEEDISKGQNIFVTNCASCHANDGGGGIGPNLTDQYWVHGGSFKDIFITVHDGVDGTSMIAWKNVLTPVQIRDVSSFIITLKGTEPANPKEPEGALYEPDKEQKDTGEADTTEVAENL